jgi:aminoglycoside phosphotransferase family enzyme
MTRNLINTSGPGLRDKLRFLSDPATYPDAEGDVEAIETHMSWVFLTGNRVYKLKKPVKYSFLDFRTLEKRKQDVEDEIRLNSRLSPDVYLGMRTLRQAADGSLSLNEQGTIVDWLVEMRRLPEERTLEALMAKGEVTRADIRRVVEVLSEFYRSLPPADITADALIGRFEDEHAETAAVLSDPKMEMNSYRVAEVLRAFDASFDAARPLLRDRIAAGRIVEGHGDLRPEHIFLTDPLEIIDCLEFSRRLRTLDPFEEITFLGLEAAQMGVGWVHGALCDGLSAALQDEVPPQLLAFYWRYRALLRARLALVHLSEPRVRKPAKWRPLARHYITLAEEADVRFRLPEGR